MIKIHLVNVVLNELFLPKCPKLTEEGGGPIANQKVLIFLSQIGGDIDKIEN